MSEAQTLFRRLQEDFDIRPSNPSRRTSTALYLSFPVEKILSHLIGDDAE